METYKTLIETAFRNTESNISKTIINYINTMETYKNLIEKSFRNAESNISKITNDIITMDGMSGTKTRHFYNNLLNTNDARYLEIGTYKGSSVCSAMCGNKAKIV